MFKETSKERVKKKIQNYMSKKKITHILDYRHGITYPKFTRSYKAITGQASLKQFLRVTGLSKLSQMAQYSFQ